MLPVLHKMATDIKLSCEDEKTKNNNDNVFFRYLAMLTYECASILCCDR